MSYEQIVNFVGEMSTFFVTRPPFPLPNHKQRILATEREVCPNIVEVFAFSLLLFTRLDLRIDLVEVTFRGFRIFVEISFEFTMRSEKKTPRTTGIKHFTMLGWTFQTNGNFNGIYIEVSTKLRCLRKCFTS
jgi:hypothetical protein